MIVLCLVWLLTRSWEIGRLRDWAHGKTTGDTQRKTNIHGWIDTSSNAVAVDALILTFTSSRLFGHFPSFSSNLPVLVLYVIVFVVNQMSPVSCGGRIHLDGSNPGNVDEFNPVNPISPPPECFLQRKRSPLLFVMIPNSSPTSSEVGSSNNNNDANDNDISYDEIPAASTDRAR